MRNLTICTTSLESARGFLDALVDFEPSLVVRADGTYQVVTSLDAPDRHIIRVLNVLEAHVTACAAGPARLELDGRCYLLDALDAEAAPDAA